MVPLHTRDQSEKPMPTMVVNAAMRSVVLERDPAGQWRPRFHAAFIEAGMAPPGPGLKLYKPVGARARLTVFTDRGHHGRHPVRHI